MASKKWDQESIRSLLMVVLNDELKDCVGFETRDELYSSLVAAAESSDPDTRGYIMQILYRLDRPRAYTFLIQRLQDEDEHIRAGAVELLAVYGERITSYLIPLLQNDPSAVVRCSAAAMLGYHGTSDALVALKRATEVDHATNYLGYDVSSLASHAIKLIKARNRPGAPPYDPLAPRSLKMEMEIDEQEDDEID